MKPEAQGQNPEWVKQTRLFRRWERMKKEINDHKWYESERKGYDIGWDRAAVDWLVRHGGKRADDTETGRG